MLSVWLRVIRVRFLLSSIIAVSAGLSINWWQNSNIDVIHAAITMGGVIALHASVDLLNDYWDFKRGIDKITKRTKMSGGSGVLPEGLLQPSQVYRAGMGFLILGSLVGGYFVFVSGWLIAAILLFAIVSIYFYSTKIVDSGLAEVFVVIKGTMIVLGTYFIQTSVISVHPILGGIVVGVLSSLVLFITSFPDYDADRSKGRKTLVIVLGREKATLLVWVFPTICYAIIILGILLEIFPVFCLMTLFTIPLMILTGRSLKGSLESLPNLTSVMVRILSFSRITGALFVISFLVTFV